MKNRFKGVTLLETLIYLSLFSIIIMMILNFMFSTQESNLKTERKGQLHQSSQFLIQHLSYTFSKTTSVNEGGSIFNSDSGRLVTQLGSGVGTYLFDGSNLTYNDTLISDPKVRVTRFRLEPVYNNDNVITGVKTEIVLVSVKDGSITRNINMLFTLR